MIVPFIIVSILTCIAVYVLVCTVATQAYKEGYDKGYSAASYDAAMIQTDINNKP